MDKFGSHARKRAPLWQMLQDLDMNDNRITSLGYPKNNSDAVTKQWVTHQMKNGKKDINDLEAALKAISKELEAMKKQLNVIKKRCGKKFTNNWR